MDKLISAKHFKQCPICGNFRCVCKSIHCHHCLDDQKKILGFYFCVPRIYLDNVNSNEIVKNRFCYCTLSDYMNYINVLQNDKYKLEIELTLSTSMIDKLINLRNKLTNINNLRPRGSSIEK